MHLQVPEDRKVGLASEFLEDEPQYWWTEVSGGEHGRFAWADFKRLFNERYFSPSHRIRIQDEFLNPRKGSLSVQEFQQKFLSLAYHVPHLIDSESTKIYRFIQALGGVYTERMEAVSYASFNDASAAAIRIENTRRSRGFDTPGHGLAKRSNSASESGSTAGSGQSSGTSSGSTANTRGNPIEPKDWISNSHHGIYPKRTLHNGFAQLVAV